MSSYWVHSSYKERDVEKEENMKNRENVAICRSTTYLNTQEKLTTTNGAYSRLQSSAKAGVVGASSSHVLDWGADFLPFSNCLNALAH